MRKNACNGAQNGTGSLSSYHVVMSAQNSFNRHHLAAIDAAIDAAVAARSLPGAVYRLERGAAHAVRAYGRLDFGPDAAPVTGDTVFDVASLTKVLVTAPAILLLHEAGQIDLDAPLLRYLPECAGGGKDAITVRQLLTHTSGLRAGLPASPAWQGREAALLLASLERVTHLPGSVFRYSDINYILLGVVIERVAGVPLDAFAWQRIFAPLRMWDTGYRPLACCDGRTIAPTQRGAMEVDASMSSAQRDLAPGAVLQGHVHDPTVRRMGGVAGSAGVFSTARDVARFARMLLAGGELDGVRVLHADSVRLLSTAQSPPGIAALRGMGMDIDSPFARRPRGRHYQIGSYGHTGYTGCILWIDPQSRSFYVFLSNRVYPDDRNSILPLYDELGTLSAVAALSAQQ